MPGPVYKDSCSRCDPPSMLFDAVRYPNTIHAPVKITEASRTKDVLEKKTSNHDLLERWQTERFQLPHETYAVVVQVGKYVFLAIMLPPYLLCYGLPKWFLVDLLPQVFTIAKNECMRVGRFFSEFSKTIVDIMKGMMKQLIGDSVKTFHEKSKEFMKFLFHQWSSFKEILSEWLPKPGQWISNVVDGCVIKIQEAFSTMFKSCSHAGKRVKEKAKEWLRPIDEKIELVLKKINEMILEPLRKWIEPKKKAFVNTCQKITHAIKEKIAFVKRKIREIIFQPIYKATKATLQTVQAILQPIMAKVPPLFNLMVQPLIQLTGYLQPFYKRFARAASSKKTALQKRFGKVMAAGAGMIRKSARAVFRKSFQSLQNLARKINPKRFLKRDSKENPFQKMVRKVKHIGKSLKRLGSRGLKWVKDASLTLIKLMQKMKRFLKDFFLAAPKKILKGIVRSWIFAMHAARQAAYMVQVFGIVISALFGQGMLFVREVTTEIFSRISFKT